jgi:hypothetical protein
MKLSIQLKGNAIALLIEGDKEERDGTYFALYNHEATDCTEPEQTASGAYIITARLAKFTRGIANWLQFKSGLQMETERTRYLFEQRAQMFIDSLPRAVILRNHDWQLIDEN